MAVSGPEQPARAGRELRQAGLPKYFQLLAVGDELGRALKLIEVRVDVGLHHHHLGGGAARINAPGVQAIAYGEQEQNQRRSPGNALGQAIAGFGAKAQEEGRIDPQHPGRAAQGARPFVPLHPIWPASKDVADVEPGPGQLPAEVEVLEQQRRNNQCAQPDDKPTLTADLEVDQPGQALQGGIAHNGDGCAGGIGVPDPPGRADVPDQVRQVSIPVKPPRLPLGGRFPASSPLPEAGAQRQ